jgi:benzoate/toluate 1,2-dioxygenase beta subunit
MADLNRKADGSAGAAAGSADGAPAPAESVLYVDDRLYEALAAEAATARSRLGPSDFKDIEQVRAFLFWEARLLDDRRYRDWLNLLTEDFVYWVPASLDALDPRAESSINFDDRRRVIDRIVLIETGSLHAQIPPSRMTRNLSNTEVWTGEAGSLHVHSNIVVWEYRRGRMSTYVGKQEHKLVPGGGSWQIRKKVTTLLDCDAPQGNITFII